MTEDETMTDQLRRAARLLQEPPRGNLPADFAARVAREALAPASRSAADDGFSWVEWLRSWWQPRMMSPAVQVGWAVLLCAVTATLTLWGSGSLASDEGVLVRFAVDVPAAHSVALAGDFNDWDPSAVRLRPAGQGQWETLVPLQPGVYQYMFVIDGQQWILDPMAMEQIDDGFGQRNSLMRIRPISDRTTSDALDFL